MAVSKRSIINKRSQTASKHSEYSNRLAKYKKAVINNSRHARAYRKRLEKFDAMINKIRSLANFVATFTGYNVRDIGDVKFKKNTPYTQLKLAKSIFYKYGIENGISQLDLREYVGAGRSIQPSEYRQEFNRAMLKDSNLKQVWENFKEQYHSYAAIAAASQDFIDNRVNPGA